jgi:hypothetical protein
MSKTKKATKSKRASFKGCSAAIHALYARGLKPEKIITKIRETWPACSLGAVIKLGTVKAKAKPAKVTPALLKAATKAPAKSKTPPPKAPAPVAEPAQATT